MSGTTVTSGVATTLPRAPLVATRDAVLLSVYLLGLCVFLVRLATGTTRARRLAREATIIDGVHASRFCAAPVTVGFFRPVVILPEHWREWSRAQLDVILTHEGEHARRRDSRVQLLALLNRAVFWFHPVAWWLERNLSALAEQACDDVVLGRGHNPRDYAEYLIDIARSMANSEARLNFGGMEMPGAALPKRIRRIMEGGQAPLISRSRMAYVVAACVITCAAFTGVTLARVQQAVADQSAKTERHFDALQILTPPEGVDLTAFSADLLQTVKRNWYAKMPAEATQDTKGKVVVRFGIQKDGSLGSVPIVEFSSGSGPLDDAAVSAIQTSAPFDHLPESFKGSNIELLLTFLYNLPPSDAGSAAQPSLKFVLGDLKIEGDVYDRDGVRDRVLNQFNSREYSDAKKLSDTVAEFGVREDLQDRGYFEADITVVGSQILGIADGKQRVLLTVSVNEGEQFHLGSLVVNAPDPSVTIPPPEVIQELIHLKRGDLFDLRELRAGLNRLKLWYVAHGHANDRTVNAFPEFHINDTQHVIDLTITVSK
jgi:TonB family protein